MTTMEGALQVYIDRTLALDAARREEREACAHAIQRLIDQLGREPAFGPGSVIRAHRLWGLCEALDAIRARSER